jgi:hypothetical protein
MTVAVWWLQELEARYGLTVRTIAKEALPTGKIVSTTIM